jgi:mannose-6-phosphate isomerase-like protein (cupin superfamily)
MTKRKTPEFKFDPDVVARKLRFNFPGAKIVPDPDSLGKEAKDAIRELVAEVEPTDAHPDHSVAVAVLGQSIPHHHKLATETYRVLSGTIELKLGEKAVKLAAGQEKVVPPGIVRSAKSVGESYAWVRVTSEPGWTSEDHVLELRKKDE